MRGLTSDMARPSATGRTAQVALIVLTAFLSHGQSMAASDVADAVMQQDPARLQRLLAGSADVNAAQADGTTALHWAAYHGDAATARKLLAAHANPGLVTDTGMTPLALACESGSPELVKLLLGAAGARRSMAS